MPSEPTSRPYEILDHTADVLLKAYGRDREDLFRNALKGLYAVVGEIEAGDVREAEPIVLEAEGRENLLHDWLAEALYFAQARRELFREYAFAELTDTKLRADVLPAAIDADRSVFHQEVKGVTYHELAIRREGDLWVATVVVDL